MRFRNVVLNAKDPVSLFYRDIPKILDDKILCQCDENFIINFDKAIEELQGSYSNLIAELSTFLFESFGNIDRKESNKRFEVAEAYLGESELKILHKNISEIDSSDQLWIEKMATFINKSRVPKDWNDEDVANFKVKVKELAFKFTTIETTIGTKNVKLDEKLTSFLNELLQLSKPQQVTILRKVVGG